MKWIEATVYTHHDALELFSAALMEYGIDSFAINDRSDFEELVAKKSDQWDLIDEELENTTNVQTNIKVYLSDDREGQKNFRALLSVVDKIKAQQDVQTGPMRVEVATVDDEDWVKNWKALFSSFPIGERFLVKAPWAEDVKTDREILVIDPAASFGSGLHESTKLCVQALERYVKKGDVVADVGCGSGILSVASAKLGAKAVYATDVDEAAVNASLHCASLNDAEKIVYVQKQDLLPIRQYNVIVANIFPDVIVRLCPDAYECLCEGGILIASGILNQYENDVRDAFVKQGFKKICSESMNEWVCICAEK